MFLYTVSNYDIHSFVADSDGLQINGINVSRLTLADDTALMSLSPKGLQAMMDRAHQYGRKWRLRFSSTKSKVVVFGETNYQHKRNKLLRSWSMGDSATEEVDSYNHVGIMLYACSQSDRTKRVVNKGKGLLASLAGVGVKFDGLNPIYSARVWDRMCVPSVLYGCEVWYDLKPSEMLALERLQRYAGRLIQGFHLRTHTEIVIAFLGWISVMGRIRKFKLLFLRKIISMKSNTVIKQMFMFRLAQYQTGAVYAMKGFIPEIHQILDYYGLTQFLDEYNSMRYFPVKKVWSSILKDRITLKENESYVKGLMAKTVEHVALKSHPSIQTHSIYRLMTSMSTNRNKLSLLIKLLSIPEGIVVECGMCKQIISNIVIHMFVYCVALNSVRNTMWEEIINMLDVEFSVALDNKSDSELVSIFL